MKILMNKLIRNAGGSFTSGAAILEGGTLFCTCPPQSRALRFFRVQPFHTSRPAAVVLPVEAKETPILGSPTENKLKQLNFPPFVKGFFLGEFNKSILSYAEVLNNERYFALQKQSSELCELLKSQRSRTERINESGAVPDELLVKLRQLDLYGLTVPLEYGGSQLMWTEIVRLLELVADGGRDISLSELLHINELHGTKPIVEHGTKEQKDKFLARLAEGELWTAFCLAEEGVGSDPSAIESEAVKVEDTDTYLLTGKKTWVSNALRADVFLVFAKVKTRNYLGEWEHLPTAFLVDRAKHGVESGTIDISQPYDLASFNGLQVCDVTFNDVVLTAEDVLGQVGDGLTVLHSVHNQSKFVMAGEVLSRLRHLLDETTEHVLGRWQYGSKLADFELIKHNLAKCASRMYALESMLYLTAGLADVGINPDIQVESAIVKQYAAETSDFVTRHCLAMIGAKSNLAGSQYQTYLAENQLLQSWQGSNNILKLFIGLSGMMHLAEKRGEDLMKIRHPLLNPFKRIKYLWSNKLKKYDMHPLTMKLENHVHPRLVNPAKDLEWAVTKLGYVSQLLLMKEGVNIQISEVYLERMADMAIQTYAMSATLARASRSYVVGQIHAEKEVALAYPLIFESKRRVRDCAWECMTFRSDQGNRDRFLLSAGNYVIDQGGYFPVSPITKNQF